MFLKLSCGGQVMLSEILPHRRGFKSPERLSTQKSVRIDEEEGESHRAVYPRMLLVVFQSGV